jgi:hypothetical protein
VHAVFAIANDWPLKGDALVFEEKVGLVPLRLERFGDKVVGASLTAPQSLSTREAPGVAAVAESYQRSFPAPIRQSPAATSRRRASAGGAWQ